MDPFVKWTIMFWFEMKVICNDIISNAFNMDNIASSFTHILLIFNECVTNKKIKKLYTFYVI
jgi:hypothetical protein